MWLTFINHPTVYSRSFMDFSKDLNAEEILFYSDASGNENLGFGGLCGNSWMFAQWEPGIIAEFEPNIEFLELYAVLAVALNCLHHYRNRRITIFCDNQSVVAMINNSTSSCKNCLMLIRRLILHSLKLNIRVFAKYMSSKNNRNSDLLSRLKISTFLQENLDAEHVSTPVPGDIWPISKIWIN